MMTTTKPTKPHTLACPTRVEGEPATGTPAARGLKLLNKQQRQRHPRAQVQTLRRMAVRALSRADWQLELAATYPGDPMYAVDPAEQAKLRRKVDDCLAACLYLNRTHNLGYPVA